MDKERRVEAIHREMFRLHGDLYNGALRRVRSALLSLHELEADSREDRAVYRKRIQAMERVRELLESVGSDAATLRGAFLKEDGCSGACRHAAVRMESGGSRRRDGSMAPGALRRIVLDTVRDLPEGGSGLIILPPPADG